MRHVAFGVILVVYVFVVGHFNFPVALATGSVLWTAYRRHDGELDKWFSTLG